MKKIIIIIIIALHASLLTLHVSQAQIIHVPADQPTIQAGIDAATTGDTVLVADGTYLENINFLGKAITVASYFIMDADTNHINNTIIDGSQPANPDFGSVVSLVMGEDTTSIIKGFTITGGSGTLNQEINELVGGGIYLINSGATISHNRIINNHIIGIDISAGGAGIFCEALQAANFLAIDNNEILNNSTTSNSLIAYAAGIYSSTSCMINNNLIEYNSCMSPDNKLTHGGGMTIYPYIFPGLIATIKDNIIRHNSLQGFEADGAGIFSVEVPHLTITGNDISYNTIDCPVSGFGNGGGILVLNSSESVVIENNDIIGNEIFSGNWARGGGIAFWEPSAKVDIINNNIADNLVQGMNNRGPGIWFRYPSGDISVIDNQFLGNTGPVEGTQSGAGGGLCIMDATGNVIIDRNMFVNNEIYNGGGLYVRRSLKTTITNNLFVENHASRGGALSFQYPAGKNFSDLNSRADNTMVINNTITQNTALEHGGGTYLSGLTYAPQFFNCIFWDNSASLGSDLCNLMNVDIPLNYSAINPDNISGGWTGTGNINEDPLFDLSGPHPYALMPNSPCIDAGTPDTTGLNLPPCDIMGCVRIWDGDGDGIAVIDMGAYEFDSPVVGIPQSEIKKPKSEISVYPNPFTRQTTLEFTLQQGVHVHLAIYNQMGKQVAVPVDEYKPAGVHKVSWNAAGLPAGIYYIRLQAGNQIYSGKMILMK